MFCKNVFASAKIIAFLIHFSSSQLFANQSIEQALVVNLLNGYNRAIRPDPLVDVYMGVQVKQIVGLDEKNQILTSSLFVEQWWEDSRLSWNSTLFGEIQQVNILLKSIWLPDINILNSASGDGYFKINADFSYANIRYDGSVYLAIPALSLQTKCSMDIQNYPFDSQICNLIFTSWSFSENQVIKLKRISFLKTI